MLKRLATMLWGNFESKEELKKFGHSCTYFLWNYWYLLGITSNER